MFSNSCLHGVILSRDLVPVHMWHSRERMMPCRQSKQSIISWLMAALSEVH